MLSRIFGTVLLSVPATKGSIVTSSIKDCICGCKFMMIIRPLQENGSVFG